MKRGLAIGVIVAVAVVVGVGAFFGGKAVGGGGTPTAQEAIKALQNMTAQERAQVFQNGAGNGTFGGGTRGANGGAGGFTTGTIVSGDSSSITAKLSDGGTKLVLFAPSTVIAVSKTGSAADLTTGQEVTVTGSANTDGSVTATRIQVGAIARPTGTPGAGGTNGTSGNSTGTTLGGNGQGNPPDGAPGGPGAPGGSGTPTTLGGA
jgi:hypothetical protein